MDNSNGNHLHDNVCYKDFCFGLAPESLRNVCYITPNFFLDR